MKIHEIKEMPTSTDQLEKHKNYHESCFRSYQILQKVKEWLEYDTPPKVIKEIIEELER